MADDLATIGYAVDLTGIKKLNKGLDGIAKTGEKTEKRMDKSAKSMAASLTTVGTALTAIGASAGLLSVVNTTRLFNKEISSLSAITGAAGKDLQFLTEQAKEFGATTTLSATEAATALKLIASAKPDLLSNAAALAQVTKEAIALAEASGTSLPEAAAALGSTLNQFGLGADSASMAINTLAASSKFGSASIVDVSLALKNAGSAASTLGLDLAETVAGIQALGKVGINGAEAGTKLRQVMLRLEKTGSKELQPTIVGLSQAIENLSKKNLTNIELMKLFGDEAFSVGSSLIDQKNSFAQLNREIRNTTTAYEQARINNDNLDGDIKRLGSTVESLSISMGSSLDPALRSTTQSINDLLSNSEALFDGLKAGASVYATFAAVQGGKALAATVASTSAAMAETTARAATTLATANQTKSELLLVAAQQKSLISQLAQAQTEKAKAAIRVQLAVNTQILTSAEAKATAATNAYTTAAGRAAFASRALGAATKFMLGPWGLLLTAVGVAATAFLTTKSASDELTSSLDEQLNKAEELQKQYEKMSRKRFGAEAIDVQRQLIDMDRQILEAEEKLNKARSTRGPSSGGLVGIDSNFAAVAKASAELKSLTDQKGKLDSLYGTMLTFFEKGLPTAEAMNKPLAESVTLIKTASDSYKKWLASVNDAANPTAALAQEIERINAAMEKGDLSVNNASIRVQQLRDEINAMNVTPMDEWINATIAAAEPTRAIYEEISKVNEAMKLGQISSKIGSKRLEQLGEDLGGISDTSFGNPFQEMTNGAQEAMGAMSTMFESGSKDAQRLGVAMTALNLVSAIGAVLNQGKGDPYTAFGRMAAMASAVAALGISVNSAFGSDIQDKSGDAQAAQGLNQWGEKANSIDDSLSIVANATEDLVGINTSMLSALQNMRMSLSGAADIVARDVTAPNVNTNNLGIINPADAIIDPFKNTPLNFLGDWVGNAIGKYFGGSSKVTNEGVRILGGSLNELLNEVTAQSFQQVDYKKWKYGSTKTKTEFQAVGDSVNQQLSLVFNSLADAVGSGAGALGLSAKSTAEAINGFVVDTISISLKGLSASDQAEAFNNVFSQVFNDLASEVIPWLSDLQMAGEDLGTTLSRVSTEVAIADLMVERFGVTFGSKLANPELYAKAADSVAMLVGGIEALSSTTSSFINSFASDEIKLSISQDALIDSFSAVGLALPKTATGMWELMQGLDGSTESGQKQIATILNLTDVSSDYYDLLGEQQEAMASLSDSLADTIMGIYDISDGVSQVGLDAALAAARFGDFSLAESLNLGDYNLDASDFASASAFTIAQAEAANKLLELSRLSSNASGDVQTQQLDVLNSINQNIIASMQATTELLVQQNALQAESADNLDRINNNGVRIEQ